MVLTVSVDGHSDSVSIPVTSSNSAQIIIPDVYATLRSSSSSSSSTFSTYKYAGRSSTSDTLNSTSATVYTPNFNNSDASNTEYDTGYSGSVDWDSPNIIINAPNSLNCVITVSDNRLLISDVPFSEIEIGDPVSFRSYSQNLKLTFNIVGGKLDHFVRWNNDNYYPLEKYIAFYVPSVTVESTNLP